APGGECDFSVSSVIATVATVVATVGASPIVWLAPSRRSLVCEGLFSCSVMVRGVQWPRLDIRLVPEQSATHVCRTGVLGWGSTTRARLKFRPGRSLSLDSAESSGRGNKYLASKRWACPSVGSTRAASGDPAPVRN